MKKYFSYLIDLFLKKFLKERVDFKNYGIAKGTFYDKVIFDKSLIHCKKSCFMTSFRLSYNNLKQE